MRPGELMSTVDVTSECHQLSANVHGGAMNNIAARRVWWPLYPERARGKLQNQEDCCQRKMASATSDSFFRPMDG
jgi:hypothetical protein